MTAWRQPAAVPQSAKGTASGLGLAGTRQPADAGQARNFANWQEVAVCEAEAARNSRAFDPITQGAEPDRTGHHLKGREPDTSSYLPGSAGISPIMGRVQGRASASEAVRSVPVVAGRPVTGLIEGRRDTPSRGAPARRNQLAACVRNSCCYPVDRPATYVYTTGVNAVRPAGPAGGTSGRESA